MSNMLTETYSLGKMMNFHEPFENWTLLALWCQQDPSVSWDILTSLLPRI